MSLSPSIFLIESPLQLFNAIEARNFFNLENCELIIVYSLNINSNKQINQLLDYYPNWNKIYKIVPIEKKYFRIRITKYIIDELIKIVKTKTYINYLFIGDHRPDFMIHFVNITKYDKLFLLDDGTATIDIMDNHINGKTKINLKFFLKEHLFGFKLKKDKEIMFFSIYSNILLKNNIVSNNYKYFREKINLLSIDENKIIFLGSCIVELKAINQDVYIMYLSKIKKYFGNKQIIYLPHRRESEEKLILIEKELKIRIERTDCIIELYLIKNKTKKLPFVVTGFFCSALLNLNVIFENKIQINSFYINNGDFDEKYVNRFECMYSYYKKYLKVIDDY